MKEEKNDFEVDISIEGKEKSSESVVEKESEKKKNKGKKGSTKVLKERKKVPNM